VNWKHYINNGFSGCRLIAYAHDNCRHRDVQIFAIPGHYDDVGIKDGVDAWIAPVITGHFFHNPRANIAQIMLDLRAGRPIAAPVPMSGSGGRRRAVLLDPEPPRRQRKAIIEDQPQQPRSRRAIFS